ncbi:UNVERIFIED_CONTAM: hypothetical protein GTU68_002931 [Idotea baltica]|nr:hypothetical protein [Idotea baltica]
MVEAAYHHHDLHYRYINCEVSSKDLETAMQGAKAMGWVGFNCSMPHKVAIIEYLDGLGESAQLIGAVNTIVKRGNKWIGENTDGKGFLQAVQEVTTPTDKHITLFGAGGAARAIAVELALAGAMTITIVNRSRERAEVLVDNINKNTNSTAIYHPWTEGYSIEPNTDIIINATSIGLNPKVDEQLKIDFESITTAMVVADCIPNPPRTHLLKTALSKGCTTVNGLKMLVNQGVIGIKYWTNVDVDPAIMYDELKRVLNINE